MKRHSRAVRMSPVRFERTTCSLGNCRSIQLSYGDETPDCRERDAR